MKSFFSTLMRWLGRLRNILANGIFILLLLMLAAAFFAEQPQVPDHAALILDPTGSIVEEITLPSTSGLPLRLSAPNQTQLSDLLAVIAHASDDPRIQMMVLKLDGMDKTALPMLQSLRKAIEAFKTSGKMVVAIGPNYSQSQYYLAAAADQVFLDPLGVVGLQGFGVYRNYIKDALEKLHVDIQVFRAGKYKAAIEPLIRNDMSEADKVSNRALLHVLWQAYKDDVAQMRHIKADRLQRVLDHPSKYLAAAGGSTAKLAKAEGLVDALADHGSIEDYIAGAMGVASGAYASIEMRPYLKALDDGEAEAKTQPNQVGIITASGMILDGKQPPGSVGSASMVEMLDQAMENDQIKAVVIRIDSPGGSAQASEFIRSEIVRLKKSGKPVVVSMGSMAASGGYWMATPADQIWALPTTITGSIGAFGVLPNVQHGLDQLGIHSDGLGTTAIASGIRVDRALPAELKQVMALSMQHIYRSFLQVVAKGRAMPLETVAGIAQGRVWSGLDAQHLGLVDALGDLDDAVESAARLAGIEQDYAPIRIRQPLSLQEKIMGKIFGGTEALGSQIAAALGMRATTFRGVWLPESLQQELGKLVYLAGLSEGQPTIFAMCNVRVE